MSQQIARRTLLRGAAGALGGVSGAAATDPPNVLFVFPDEVRACEFGYSGGKNIPTPNIDRLASQGIAFTNCLSTNPLCTPYRAMLQTGRWPTLSGGLMNFINLPSTGNAMADVFSRGGYNTGYIGKWHLAAGFRAGGLYRKDPPPPVRADPEFVPPGPARLGWQYWAANNFCLDFAQKGFYYRDTPEKQYWNAFETDGETDDAIAYMKKFGNAGKPFFLTVAPHPPHPPWRPDQTPGRKLDAMPKGLHCRPNVKFRNERSTFDTHCYFAMLSNVDDNVGRLMKHLDDSGLADNTIVVFTSDHGEMMASHGRYGKMVPYAESVNVPLLIRWPKHIRPGTKSDALFTPIDFFPTLASMCGLTLPAGVDGMDLSGQVLRQTGPQREAALMMNFSADSEFPENTGPFTEWRAIRTKQYTYVRWINGAEELYDNAADPYQMRNLFDGRNAPAVMARLRSNLKDLLVESHDEFLTGDRYGAWFNKDRDLVRNALGPTQSRG